MIYLNNIEDDVDAWCMMMMMQDDDDDTNNTKYNLRSFGNFQE